MTKNSKKRIAFFIVSTHLGGAEKSLLQLLSSLKGCPRTSIAVISPLTQGPLVDELNQLDIKIQTLTLPKGFLSLSRKKVFRTIILSPWLFVALTFHIFRLKRFLQKENFDSIHSTGIKNHILLGVTARWVRSHFILHIRDIIKKQWLKKILNALDRPNIDWVSNSKVTQSSLYPIKSRVIYNGFEVKKQPPQRKAQWIDEQLNFKPPVASPVRIGIVGAIARWKGQREFLAMAKQVSAPYPQSIFYVVGSEIYDTTGEKGELQTLKEWVLTENLQDRIRFVPFQKDIDAVYGALDILVHGSIEPEPFGRVIVEALGQGCVVIAADKGGPLEIIEDRESGLLYETGSSLAMANSVMELLSKPELFEKLKAHGKHVPEKFNMETHLKEMKEALHL